MIKPSKRDTVVSWSVRLDSKDGRILAWKGRHMPSVSALTISPHFPICAKTSCSRSVFISMTMVMWRWPNGVVMRSRSPDMMTGVFFGVLNGSLSGTVNSLQRILLRNSHLVAPTVLRTAILIVLPVLLARIVDNVDAASGRSVPPSPPHSGGFQFIQASAASNARATAPQVGGSPR